MPSSKYVYTDDTNRPSGTLPNRRRSQRIRRKTLGNASNLNDTTMDPDETVLDETILLSDEEEVADGREESNNKQPSKSDNMDVDENNTNDHHPHNEQLSSPASSTGMPMAIRGGAEGFLSNDPLTSSTMKSTPFSAIRARARTNAAGRMNTKERLKKLADQFDSDESDDDDDDMNEAEFLQAIAKKQALRQAQLAESQQQQRMQRTQTQRTQQQQQSFASFRPNESLQTQQYQQSRNESEDTARMANHDTSSSTQHYNQSLSESFAATQPWEKELNSSILMNSMTGYQQNNAPQKDHRRQEQQKDQQPRNQPSMKGPRGEDRRQESHYQPNHRRDATGSNHQSVPLNDHRRQESQVNERQGNHSSLNAPQKDHRGNRHQEQPRSLPEHPQQQRDDVRRQRDYHERQISSETQPNNHHSLPVYQEQNANHRDQYMHTSNTVHIHQDKRSSSSLANPYGRKHPPELPKKAASNVPRISLEHLKSGKKSRSKRDHTSTSDGSTNGGGAGTNKGDTWQEEAFRSSLLDLLGSFPSNYFDSQDDNDDDAMEGNKKDSAFFATSATTNIDDESPHSTTSQSAASAQLNRKRLFDAAARALARLAIASRHSPKGDDSRNSNSRNSGGSSNDGVSPPDFNPPSPRSLPSYMSVLNVHDDSSPGSNGDWGAGNATAMLSSSKEVFCGQSVHGRNARSVQLSTLPHECGMSSNPFSSWSLEQLACGSMLLAAQVCHEASCDPNFDQQYSSNEAEGSCRVAGFAQNSCSARGGIDKRPAVSSALVESSLGFLATAFACLESDTVYSVLKAQLKASNSDPIVIVFDALSHFAPVSSQVASAEEVCTIPALSLLALSRGLEAAIFVARYATSLDPSSACAAYSSPQLPSVSNTNCSTIDTGIDECGVGWVSALGRDLGLRLEDNQNSRPRHMHLREVAEYAYDFIVEFNPMIVNDVGPDDGSGGQRRGNSRRGLYIETQADRSSSQAMDAFVCRQSSVMKDRIYAAIVEYLSSMIHIGIVSGWLTSAPAYDDGDNMNEDNGVRTVDRLCQKLFYVVETRARLRRSTNQNTAGSDPGDSEAVCAASLSLLILALPEHASPSAHASLSTSFRQMGNSTGSIEDLLHSPLVRKMVEMGLSWQDTMPREKNNKGIGADMNFQSTNSAIYILSDVCMAGGSSLISSHFSQRLDGFLQSVIQSICKRGQSGSDSGCFNIPSMSSSLLLLLQLHKGLPILVRKFLRDFIEKSPESGDAFVGGILRLSADKYFSVSSCASALLRALIDGNPSDRTQDRLAETILYSLDAEHVGSNIGDVLRSFVEVIFTSVHSDIPNFSSRWHPRICSLGDLLGICMPMTYGIKCFAASLSEEVLGLFVDVIECDEQKDTLGASATLSLLFLVATFANNCSNLIDGDESSFLTTQRHVKEKLLRSSYFLPVVGTAMAQGASADTTHRSLKLQNSLFSISDDRSLAFTFTRSSDAMSRKTIGLRHKLALSENELRDIRRKHHQLETDCDSLSHSIRNQRLEYERRLELTRSEAIAGAQYASEIHVHERRRAEEKYATERELRRRTEQANEELTHTTMSDKARIKELEELLEKERKSRQDFQSAFENCKNELSTTSTELEKTSKACHDLQEILSTSEEKISNLSAKSEDAEANLDDTCAKLIKLATIYQNKESEMEKYKAELRSAVTSANRHADTAIQKYESAKQQNKLLSKKLEDVTSELKDVKAHRADVQRMRKNAPVAYLNQLHNDPRIQDKRQSKQSRRNRTGKENSVDGR